MVGVVGCGRPDADGSVDVGSWRCCVAWMADSGVPDWCCGHARVQAGHADDTQHLRRGCGAFEPGLRGLPVPLVADGVANLDSADCGYYGCVQRRGRDAADTRRVRRAGSGDDVCYIFVWKFIGNLIMEMKKGLCWLVVGLLLLLTSCATKTKIEYRDRDVNNYITNTVHDTLIDKTTDSVYFEVKVKGDTVFQTKYRERVVWKEKIKEQHDTLWRDSVVTEYKETVKEVVKIPNIYKFSLVFMVIGVIFAFIKFTRWLKII